MPVPLVEVTESLAHELLWQVELFIQLSILCHLHLKLPDDAGLVLYGGP